jgi:tetratricopeptide (TPR) repeat protein
MQKKKKKITTVACEARPFSEMGSVVTEVEEALCRVEEWIKKNRDTVTMELAEFAEEEGGGSEAAKKALDVRLNEARRQVIGDSAAGPIVLPVLRAMFDELGEASTLPRVITSRFSSASHLVTVQYAFTESIRRVLVELAEPGAALGFKRLVEAFRPALFAVCEAGKCLGEACDFEGRDGCRRCKVMFSWLVSQRVDRDRSKIMLSNVDCGLFHDPELGPAALFKLNVRDLGEEAHRAARLEDLDLTSLIDGMRSGRAFFDLFGEAEWGEFCGDRGPLGNLQEVWDRFAAGHAPSKDLTEAGKRQVVEGLIRFLDEPLVRARAPGHEAARKELDRFMTTDVRLLAHDERRLDELHCKDHARATGASSTTTTPYPDLSNAALTTVPNSEWLAPRNDLVARVVAWGSQRPLPAASTLVLLGASGTGKSVLAALAARELMATGEFSFVRFLSARSAVTLTGSLFVLAEEAKLAKRVSREARMSFQLVDLMIEYLDDHARAVGKPYLLVVDDASSEVRKDVLRLSVGGLVIVTASSAFEAGGLRLEVGPFTLNESSHVLGKLHPAGAGSAAHAKIATDLELHPLAVVLAGHLLAGELSTVDELAREVAALVKAKGPARAAFSLAWGAALRTSKRLGSESAMRLLAMVATLDCAGGVEGQILLRWYGGKLGRGELPGAEAKLRMQEDLAKVLEPAGLVHLSSGDGILTMHRLVQELVLERAEDRVGAAAGAAMAVRSASKHSRLRHCERLYEFVEGCGVLDSGALQGDAALAVGWVFNTFGSALMAHFTPSSRCENALRFALKLRRAALATCWDVETHWDVVQSSLTFASVLTSRGGFVEAERVYRLALQERRSHLPAPHVTTAMILTGLAFVIAHRGDNTEPEGLLREAVDIYRAELPADHMDLTKPLIDLGNALTNVGKFDEAKRLYEEALAICRAALPAGHPGIATARHSFINLYTCQGRLAEAEKTAVEVLKMRQAARPAGHYEIAESFSYLGEVLVQEGKYAEAIEVHKQRMEGADEEEIAASLACIAACLGKLRRLPESIATFEQALSLQQSMYPPDHPRIRRTADALAFARRSLSELPPTARRLVTRQAQVATPSAARPGANLSQSERDALERELLGDEQEPTPSKGGNKNKKKK